ncbi:MAG: hypothetical protein J7L91_03485 [Candidatus Korarchaeota archaeon]|nr:hypothetical protein [Candidatus Korarchaeota archaeon]
MRTGQLASENLYTAPTAQASKDCALDKPNLTGDAAIKVLYKALNYLSQYFAENHSLIWFPTRCPGCGAILTHRSDGTLYCLNCGRSFILREAKE